MTFDFETEMREVWMAEEVAAGLERFAACVVIVALLQGIDKIGWLIETAIGERQDVNLEAIHNICIRRTQGHLFAGETPTWYGKEK